MIHFNIKTITSRKSVRLYLLPFVVVLVIIVLPVWGSNSFSLPLGKVPIPPPSPQQKLIILDHADRVAHDQERLPDIITLAGNVLLRHKGWIMHCDSAHLNDQANTVEAFGNIRIEEGDSISITSNHLFYEGSEAIAELQGNVILRKGLSALYTDNLFYDRRHRMGYYPDFGTLADSVNTLTSRYGEYNTQTNEALFEQDVHLENERFKLDTERLLYNTRTSICRIVSPTIIETTDSVTIESDNGLYNTQTRQAIFLDHSLITHPQGTLTGDSIQYDQRREIGEAFYDVEIHDTEDKILYYGDYGYIDRGNNYIYSTGRCYAVDYSEPDSVYMTADLLEGLQQTLPSHEGSADSIKVSYTKAYNHAKIYRKDMQALADSVNYFSKDSLIQLIGHPILWNDSTQIKGDFINAYLVNDSIDHVLSTPNASTVRWISLQKQDRIKADTIRIQFYHGEVQEASYRSNVESRYYLKQENINHYYGLAEVSNPQMDVSFEDKEISQIFWYGKAEGAIHPIETLSEEIKMLPGTEWEGDRRPKSPEDIIPDRTQMLSRHHPLASQLDSMQVKAFDGLAAWFRFDIEYKERLNSAQDHKTSVKSNLVTESVPSTSRAKELPTDPSSKVSLQLSPYISRPVVPIEAVETSYFIILPIYSWDSYLDRDDLNPSITFQSIGIPNGKI